tara:strand:+ start:382 stop:936 length:555 start_codon:yes stop_codon:yes gene_type:complete
MQIDISNQLDDYGAFMAKYFTFEVFADVTMKEINDLYRWSWGTWEIDIDESELCTIEDYQNTGETRTGYRINIWLENWEERWVNESGQLELPDNYSAEADYFNDMIERCELIFNDMYAEREARGCKSVKNDMVKCLEKFFPHHTFNFGTWKKRSHPMSVYEGVTFNGAYYLEEIVTPRGESITS